jgi:hypothetical protein
LLTPLVKADGDSSTEQSLDSLAANALEFSLDAIGLAFQGTDDGAGCVALAPRALRTVRPLVAARTTVLPTTAGRTTVTGTTTRPALTATGAFVAWARRTSLVEDLALLGRQDLVQLGLGLLFKFGDLLDLVVAQFQSLGNESRQQMEPAARTTSAARTTRAGTAAVLAPWAWRSVVRALLGDRTDRKGGNRQDAKDRKRRRESPHGKTPQQENPGTGSLQELV